jgi:hypothetical protein
MLFIYGLESSYGSYWGDGWEIGVVWGDFIVGAFGSYFEVYFYIIYNIMAEHLAIFTSIINQMVLQCPEIKK